ncbi:MAG: 5'/3'-nucleotidase SurE [Lachnospiraceae bacterium]|nr:5'/3'-nucleotidase SurE [Lachnospiraceae bacterium]
MNILIVNDDGIFAEGIKELAAAAVAFGKVTVVAPASQCSAMSHCITVRGDLTVKKESFPVHLVEAYSVSGTPADCVKVAMQHLLKEKPDIVFSGINFGYNVGVDILYSGTVGAAMEALVYQIPAIAFSMDVGGNYEIVHKFLKPIIEKLLKKEIGQGEMWNVNFPTCAVSECKGIKEDCKPARISFYKDDFRMEEQGAGEWKLYPLSNRAMNWEEGTDIDAVEHNYIAIGKLKNEILFG